MNKRLLLADDHAMMLEGLVRLLGSDFDVVGTATDGRMLLAEAERLRPDVIVLDVGMPELNGIEAARRLAKILPSAKIVFICTPHSAPGRKDTWQNSPLRPNWFRRFDWRSRTGTT
jgi:DNA-binding NarL/FixJ family response regulator